jgi:hypothetical protein
MLDSPRIDVPETVATESRLKLAQHSKSGDPDPRSAVMGRCLRAVSRRTLGVTFFPSHSCGSCRGSATENVPDLWAAHIHVDGCTRWSCLRYEEAQAKADRKMLVAARRSGTLDAVVRRLAGLTFGSNSNSN